MSDGRFSETPHPQTRVLCREIREQWRLVADSVLPRGGSRGGVGITPLPARAGLRRDVQAAHHSISNSTNGPGLKNHCSNQDNSTILTVCESLQSVSHKGFWP